MLAQGAAAVAGLLLARWMSVEDYALYTVAITMAGAITLLTRGGVRMGLAAQLSEHWPNRLAAGRAIASSVQARLIVSALTMPPILILAWILLTQAGASHLIAGIIVGILALTWLADLQSGVVDQVLYFDGKAVPVQNLDTAISFSRALLVIALRLFNSVSVIAALLVNLVTAALRIPPIVKWVRRSVDGGGAKPAAETTKSIRAVAIRQLPADLFNVFQSQAAIYYLTHLGDPKDLATYGALARIAQLLAPVASVSLAFFVPAFAQTKDRTLLRLGAFVMLALLPGLALIALAAIAPQGLLFFIGPSYADQAHALLVCAIAVSFANTIQVASNLVSHRGWNRWAWLRIPLGLAWCAAGPFLLPLDTVEGGYIFFAGFSIWIAIALMIDLFAARKRGEIALIGKLAN